MTASKLAFTCAFISVMSGPIALAAPCITPVSSCAAQTQLGQGSSIELYRSQAPDFASPDVTRVIIVVHGILRNADDYFSDMMGVVQATGHLDDTLVIAPHFKNEEDQAVSGELIWRGGRWKQGEFSTNGARPLTSFSVVDRIVTDLALANNFPNLETIVVTGHSAGGQFVSRFAAGSEMGLNTSGPDVHFVVANPSTYLYFNDQRAEDNSLTNFGPVSITDCPAYNDYLYGLQNRTGYLAGISPATLVERFSAHHVIIFVGSADVESELLDVSCGANLQGLNRYQRGQIYFGYLRHFFPNANSAFAVAPGVGHDHNLMYGSQVGRDLLFQ